ncbi:hypothetical protein ACFL1G_06315 [Planctomycetota bacterium]
MVIAVKIVGIIFVIMAIVYLLRPGILKRLIEFFKKRKRLYFAGLLRLVLAVFFLLTARECKFPWVIGILGVIILIAGLIIFIMKIEKLKAILEWYQKQPDLLLRLIALIVLAIGATIIFSA